MIRLFNWNYDSGKVIGLSGFKAFGSRLEEKTFTFKIHGFSELKIE